jgi:predicted Zn-dependent peptidase
VPFVHDVLVLPNGIRIIRDDDLPLSSFTVAMVLPSSARDDPDQELGVSHLLEHLIMSAPGSAGQPPLSDWVSGVGGDSNASTAQETLTYWARVPAEVAVECVSRLVDAVQRPVLSDELVSTERAVVAQELLASAADPVDRSSELFYLRLFRGHWLGRPVGGPVDFPVLTLDQVEQAHGRSLAGPACISLVGRRNLLDAAAEAIRARPAVDGGATGPARVAASWLPAGAETAVADPDADYAYLTAGGRGASRADPDWAAFEVLAALAGGVPGSMLYHRLRGQLGLSYQIYSITTSYSDCGVWRVLAGTEADRVPQLDRAIRDCLSDIADGALAPEQLRAARAQTIGATLIENEDPVVRACNNADVLLETGSSRPPAAWTNERLVAVRTEDVARAARQVLDTYTTAVAW